MMCYMDESYFNFPLSILFDTDIVSLIYKKQGRTKDTSLGNTEPKVFDNGLYFFILFYTLEAIVSCYPQKDFPVYLLQPVIAYSVSF